VRPGDLKFLTDENVSPHLVAFLRERGHDVLDVKEKGWRGKDDAFLLRKAAKTRRFIISHDRDFGKLAINRRQPCYGVIYLRLRDQRSPNVVRVMQEFLDRDLDIRAGTLIVIRESQARIRRVRF
jgi:predicted nuclease of predicted toxin-antitoxin system